MFARAAVFNKIAERRRKGENVTRMKREYNEMYLLHHSQIEDRDIWENTKQKLRIRSFPLAFWIMGFIWELGAIFVIYECHPQLTDFDSWTDIRDWCILIFLLSLGFIFVYYGKIKSITFDKGQMTMTVKKRNLCCDRRSIKTFPMKDISNVRAVYRGQQLGGVDTRKYYVIVEFERNRFINKSKDSDYSSSSEEDEVQLTKIVKDESISSVKTDIGMIDPAETEENKEQALRDIINEFKPPKEVYRRGINHGDQKGISGILFNQIDKGVPEKKGKKEELKFLQTGNKYRVQRMAILIKKFLNMNIDDFKIEDETNSLIQMKVEN